MSAKPIAKFKWPESTSQGVKDTAYRKYFSLYGKMHPGTGPRVAERIKTVKKFRNR